MYVNLLFACVLFLCVITTGGFSKILQHTFSWHTFSFFVCNIRFQYVLHTFCVTHVFKTCVTHIAWKHVWRKRVLHENVCIENVCCEHENMCDENVCIENVCYRIENVCHEIIWKRVYWKRVLQNWKRVLWKYSKTCVLKTCVTELKTYVKK